MNSAEIRYDARQSLSGNWLKGAGIILAYVIITILLSLALGLIPFIGSLVSTIISAPLTFGILSSFIKLKRREDVSAFSFFNDGFANFSKVWAVLLRTMLKLLPFFIGMIVCLIINIVSISAKFMGGPSAGIGILSTLATLGTCVLSIAMIPKSMLYSLTLYILFDNPNKSGLEIVEESERLMRGNRLNLFFLSLSFIGWALLAGFTLGIGYFFLIPYMQIAIIIFYEKLAGREDFGFASTNQNTVNSDDYEIVNEENNYEDETVIMDLTNHDEE